MAVDGNLHSSTNQIQNQGTFAAGAVFAAESCPQIREMKPESAPRRLPRVAFSLSRDKRAKRLSMAKSSFSSEIRHVS